MAEFNFNTRIQNKYDEKSIWENSSLVLKAGEIAFATVETAAEGDYSVPTVLMKVGDGTSTFAQLKWLAAPAADVYAWAKKKDPTIDELPTNLKTAIQNLQTAVGEGGSVADSIRIAIEAIDVDEVTATTGNIIGAVSQVDGKLVATTRALTAEDIPTLAIGKIDGLQDALDAKLAASVFEEYKTTNDTAVETAQGAAEAAQDTADTNAENITKIVDGTTPVAKATAADSATKATQDGNGAVIADTYETKEDAAAKLTEANGNAATAQAAAEAAQGTADANAASIAKLIGDVEGDDTKSVRNIAGEEVAKVVADAPEAYDTLKEIADFITSDTTGAASMANRITANEEGIADIIDGTTPVAKATNADSATKATQDGNGAVIADTYETKEDAAAKLAEAKEAATAASTHADELNTAMDTRVKALEEKPAAGITAEQITNWDGAVTTANTAVQDVTAGNGLKVTTDGTTRLIEIDSTATFVFNCGTSADV